MTGQQGADSRRNELLRLLYPEVVVGAASTWADQSYATTMHKSELEGTANFAPGRLAEFATGRACAREAMRQIGVIDAVPRRSDRSPQWPPAISGSITHNQRLCAAVVMRAESTSARRYLGIDIEKPERMTEAVRRRVLSQAETVRVGDLAPRERQRYVATVFSAKEAFYKAQHQLSGAWLGFDAVEVTVGIDHVTIVLSEATRSLLGDASVSANWLELEGRVAVGVTLTAPQVELR